VSFLTNATTAPPATRASERSECSRGAGHRSPWRYGDRTTTCWSRGPARTHAFPPKNDLAKPEIPAVHPRSATTIVPRRTEPARTPGCLGLSTPLPSVPATTIVPRRCPRPSGPHRLHTACTHRIPSDTYETARKATAGPGHRSSYENLPLAPATSSYSSDCTADSRTSDD
jgi:hypothetical protein